MGGVLEYDRHRFPLRRPHPEVDSSLRQDFRANWQPPPGNFHKHEAVGVQMSYRRETLKNAAFIMGDDVSQCLLKKSIFRGSFEKVRVSDLVAHTAERRESPANLLAATRYRLFFASGFPTEVLGA